MTTAQNENVISQVKYLEGARAIVFRDNVHLIVFACCAVYKLCAIEIQFMDETQFVCNCIPAREIPQQTQNVSATFGNIYQNKGLKCCWLLIIVIWIKVFDNNYNIFQKYKLHWYVLKTSIRRFPNLLETFSELIILL